MHPSALFALASITLAAASSHTRLPVVDLGYVRQRASAINETGGYVNFTNIAYASPPVGTHRWAPPQPPKRIRTIQDGGSVPKACPQGVPSWLALQQFGSPVAPAVPQSEDCLYVDVMTPKNIFRGHRKAPVLVWIHGGGSVLGSKTSNGNPAGLMKRGIGETDTDGIVYVSLNYRLGAFGYLGGSDFVSEDGTPNLGLHDQRMALNWVQKYIHHFGGDPRRVTVIGESGGASSISRQVSARLPGKVPFAQAILQSPTELPILPDDDLNTQYNNFLTAINASSLQEARAIDTATLQRINGEIVNAALPHGDFVFRGSADGVFVRGSAVQDIMASGTKNVAKAIVSYNSNEGALFTPTTITAAFDFQSLVQSRIPGASEAEVSEIVSNIYPPPGPETEYTSPYQRALLLNTELYTLCNAAALGSLYGDRTYAYEFSVPPGYHTFDTPYTFFNGPSPRVSNQTIALDMQKFFVNSATKGDPNAGDVATSMPIYGDEMQLLNLTVAGYHVVIDPAANSRCTYLNGVGGNSI